MQLEGKAGLSITGFRLTYETADLRCDSCMATDANRL
jgi:hypothetical protein